MFYVFVFPSYSCASMSLIKPICIYIKQLVGLLFDKEILNIQIYIKLG